MKKAAKIVPLVVLLAMVGVIVYAVMVWPVNPTRMKPAKSYEQLRDTVEKKTDIRVPGEKLLPWTVTERQLRMDGPSRLAKVSGFAISGTMERGGVAFNAEVSVGVTGVVGDLPSPWDVYRYVPVYLFRNQGFYMAQLCIDGSEYIIQLYYPENVTLPEEDAAYVEDALHRPERSLKNAPRRGAFFRLSQKGKALLGQKACSLPRA